MTLAQMKQEAKECCDEQLPEYPGYEGVGVVLQRVFDNDANVPIAWVRHLNACA